MALVQDLGPTLTLVYRDNNNKKANQLFYLDPAIATVAAALTAANAIRDAAVPLSDAQMIGGFLSFALTEDAIGAIVAGSEVERKLIAPFIGANIRQTYQSELPSPRPEIEQLGTDTVSPAQALVAPYLAAILANARTNRGETLTQVNGRVYVDHRNRRSS